MPPLEIYVHSGSEKSKMKGQIQAGEKSIYSYMGRSGEVTGVYEISCDPSDDGGSVVYIPRSQMTYNGNGKLKYNNPDHTADRTEIKVGDRLFIELPIRNRSHKVLEIVHV